MKTTGFVVKETLVSPTFARLRQAQFHQAVPLEADPNGASISRDRRAEATLSIDYGVRVMQSLRP